MYKKKLDHPEKESIISQLEKLEEDLDIANILLAREHAKLEVWSYTVSVDVGLSIHDLWGHNLATRL